MQIIKAPGAGSVRRGSATPSPHTNRQTDRGAQETQEKMGNTKHKGKYWGTAVAVANTSYTIMYQ